MRPPSSLRRLAGRREGTLFVIHLVAVLPDGQTAGETDTGRPGNERQEYTEGDLRSLARANRRAAEAIAQGGDRRVVGLFRNPTATVARLERQNTAIEELIQGILAGQARPAVTRATLETALAGAGGRSVAGKTPTEQAKEIAEGLEVLSAGLAEGMRGVKVAMGTHETPTNLTGATLEFFEALPTAAQRAFLVMYEGGRFAPMGPPSEQDHVIGRFLYENAGSDAALAVGRAYAEHPKEVAAFAEMAVRTYALGPVEVASADVKAMPEAMGRGQFTWEGVFKWVESSTLSSLTEQQQEDISIGVFAAHFAQGGGKPLSVAEAKVRKNTVDDLRSPGVLLAARDLDGRVSIGTHQFLILIPEHPENFDNLVDLGDETMGLIVGAYDHNGRLISAINDIAFDENGKSGLSNADLEAARELYSPGDNTSLGTLDFSTIHYRVHLGDEKTVDKYISDIVAASENYRQNEGQYNIPYPKWYENLKGVINNSSCINSNSFAQSILRYSVPDPQVPEDMWGPFALDACHATRIGNSFFQ